MSIPKGRMMVRYEFWVDMPISVTDAEVESLYDTLQSTIEAANDEFVVKEHYSSWEVDAE